MAAQRAAISGIKIYQLYRMETNNKLNYYRIKHALYTYL